MTIESKQRFLINVLFAVVALAIGFFVFKFLFAYLMPLIIGILISAAIQRPVRFISAKTRMPKSVWAIFLSLISFSIVILLIIFVGYEFYQQMQYFVNALISYLPYLSSFLSGGSSKLLPFLEGFPQSVVNGLTEMPATIINNLTGSLTNWLSEIATNVVTSAPSMLITFVVTIIATCYISKDYAMIRAFLKKQIPARYLTICGNIKELFSKNLLKVGKGYLILMGITFVELSVGLLILRVNLAVPISALIAIVDILPVLGVGTILLPWAALSAISGNIFMAVGLLIIYVIISVVRQILEPKVISTQIGMFPLVTLLSMYVGYKLFGFFGMLGFPLILIIITGLQREHKIHIWNPLSKNDLEPEDQKKVRDHELDKK